MKQSHNIFSELNNGQSKTKGYIRVSCNLFTIKLLHILQQHGFISHWCVDTKFLGKTKKPSLLVYYKQEPFSVSSTSITSFRIRGISTKKSPVFLKANDLWRLDKGLNLYILSTNRGLLTDRQARKWNVGGKLVCLVKS